MPPTLHSCLKRGLDLDVSPIDPNDIVEDLPLEHHDAHYQAAKRRRVETIALQYLRGKPPIILSASLKGPFTKEWRNPWTRDVTAERTARRDTAERSERDETKRPKASQIASPEASRAVGHTEHLHSQPEFEPLPATAPLPDEDDLSGGTQFFSIQTEQFIANNSPENPFWLRRPAASLTFPANSQSDRSPTKQRNHARQSLHLTLPDEPLGGRSLPIRATPPDAWRSSTSASMDISSLVEPAQDPHTTSSADVPGSSCLRADSAQEQEARSSQTVQNAQATPNSPPKDSTMTAVYPSCALSFDTLVPATTYKTLTTVQVPQSSPTREAVGLEGQSRLLREDVRRSIEPLVSMISTSSTGSTNRKCARKDGPSKMLRHDLVASPAPDSSTGFMYRRIRQPIGEVGTESKGKPQAVDSNSSPALKKKDQDLPVVVTRPLATVVETEVSELANLNNIVGTADGNIIQENEKETPGDEQQESYRSKQSQYSTQAAMLLAQLEFQEDSSQSSASSATLRPWSQPAQNTPPRMLHQPSPAITPLSVFNAHLDESISDVVENVHRGPPVSTQDLFNAASPFAFSTVKKKSERLPRTSLRFAVTSSRFTENMVAKSSPPKARRIPLKEKNTSALWSFTHGKSSLYSPELTSRSPKSTANDVKLPQLDFHTSLDFGPNADFTDCFLRSLNEP